MKMRGLLGPSWLLALISIFHNLLWNLMCAAPWDCVSQVLLKVPKASKKALAHLKDHFKRSLRPVQAT